MTRCKINNPDDCFGPCSCGEREGDEIPEGANSQHVLKAEGASPGAMNLDELLKVAQGATQGDWFAVHGVILVDAPGRGETDFPAIAEVDGVGAADYNEANALHIATFNPEVCTRLVRVAMAQRALVEDLAEKGNPERQALWDEARESLASLRAALRGEGE